MNQIEVEQLMIDGGRDRAYASFARNEEAGTAHNNPYAAAVYRRFVLPLSDAIKSYTGDTNRGVAAQAKRLLRRIDPTSAAFIAVRSCLDIAVLGTDNPVTTVAREIGQTIYSEVLLEAFENIEPELYFTLVRDFERRLTKSERHRMTVFKMQAAKQGIDLPEFQPEDKLAAGTIILYLLRDLGMVDIGEYVIPASGKSKVPKKHKSLTISPEVLQLISQIKQHVSVVMPMVLPCVEPPKPWVTPNDGGYHTAAMRRQTPCCIRGRARVIDESDVPEVPLRALNILQSRAWRINERLLDTVSQVQDRFDAGEVLSQSEKPRPQKPYWLGEDDKESEMSPVQVAEFRMWKADMREWYTESKERGIKWSRYWTAMRVARQFRGMPLWFVYQYDYRGRAYANTRGVSPQGSDLQKALLESNEGNPITTEAGKFWFYAAGANRYGFDKAELEDRVEWTKERTSIILSIADEPLLNTEWTKADNPYQFLAWCFEFADFHRNPATFVSRLALGQDGSCNGLQHFSAMLRDSVGGRATNLMPSKSQQDIYGLVAKATSEGLSLLPPEGLFIPRWQKHQLSRGLVKRSVMTLPYGATRFSCADFIHKEYLSKGLAPEFNTDEHKGAARELSVVVWDAIGKVVVKAREAMEWLQRASNELIDAGVTEIVWKAPSGFVVRQRYGVEEFVQVTTRIVGGARIRPQIATETDVPDKRRHRNGIAPNFVHSHDAAHMQLLICYADDHGLGHLAFIHDDYGTWADGTETLHKGIRHTFVDMYLHHHPLADFKAATGVTEPVPESGDLDIRVVLESRYFFA